MSKAVATDRQAGSHARSRTARRNSGGILWENIASSGTTIMQANSRQVRIFMAVESGGRP